MLSQYSFDDLQIIAVAQEQHAERTRLYKQWKQFDLLVVQDAFCELKLRAVPMLILLDEEGRVASKKPNEKFIAEWMNGKHKVDPVAEKTTKMENSKVNELVNEADSIVKFQISDILLDDAIEKYRKAVELNPSIAENHFRLGVAQRTRFDRLQQPEDFEQAVANWSKALELDPNQYIFRRRLEQYGPRLMKPYPFYDWVEGAITDIKTRDEEPVELKTRLSGAEVAKPSKKFDSISISNESLDPEGKIKQADDELITIEPIVVPTKVEPGKTGRVHLVLSPGKQVKWNNSSEPTSIWVECSDGLQMTDQVLSSKLPDEETSSEARSFEFEIKRSRDSGEENIKGYALFAICKDADGVCLYLRKDFEISIK